MHPVATAIAIAWVVFWVGWLVAAAGVKPGRAVWGRAAAVRLLLVVVVVVLARARVFRGQSATDDPWLQGVGIAFFVSGLAFAVWARFHIGRNWGSPMSQKVDPELVTTGPYRRVRHPIYTGIILAMVGTAVAVNWFFLIAVALLGGYFVYSAVVEERYMGGLFPDTYPEYKRGTKMLIPFLF